MRQLKIVKSITNRESASLDALAEIGKEPMITSEERYALRDLSVMVTVLLWIK